MKGGSVVVVLFLQKEKESQTMENSPVFMGLRGCKSNIS